MHAMCLDTMHTQDQDAIASLETELLHTKASADASTFFPSHAFARGGIGVLVSTGSARGPLRRLPQATQASRNLHASSRPTTCPEGIGRGWLGSSLDATSLASAAAASAVVGSAAGIPDVARHEWERVVSWGACWQCFQLQSWKGKFCGCHLDGQPSPCTHTTFSVA